MNHLTTISVIAVLLSGCSGNKSEQSSQQNSNDQQQQQPTTKKEVLDQDPSHGIKYKMSQETAQITRSGQPHPPSLLSDNAINPAANYQAPKDREQPFLVHTEVAPSGSAQNGCQLVATTTVGLIHRCLRHPDRHLVFDPPPGQPARVRSGHGPIER